MVRAICWFILINCHCRRWRPICLRNLIRTLLRCKLIQLRILIVYEFRFVGQIPRTWGETECRELFEEFGPVYQLNVLRNKSTQASQGALFILYDLKTINICRLLFCHVLSSTGCNYGSGQVAQYTDFALNEPCCPNEAGRRRESKWLVVVFKNVLNFRFDFRAQTIYRYAK